MKQKSIKKNAILAAAKTLLSLIAPLITFPYIARVLSVEALGQYNFSSSVVSYFVLLAGLGISTYAVREGARIRENRAEISRFLSEIWIINIISTVIAYVLLILSIVFIEKLVSYRILILVISLNILFNLYGKQWVYTIFEDFGYITFVQSAFQILTVCLTFIVIKKPEDVYKYAILNVLSSSGAYILYGIHGGKYVDLQLKKVRLYHLKRHIKPIFIIFGTAVASNIYMNSDIILLGAMESDHCVGLYSAAVKIYNIVKQIILAIISVSVPRLTLYAGKEMFNSLFHKVLNMLLLLTLPAMTGLFILSDNIISIFSGAQFADAAMSLRLLCIAAVFALLANLFGMSVLLPYNKENIFLGATVISAGINIILNILFIPFFHQNAAAFTTALSQGIVLYIHYKHSREYVSLKESVKCLLCTVAGCIGIVGTCLGIRCLRLDVMAETAMCICISVLVYGLIQILTKNDFFIENLNAVLKGKRKIEKGRR